MFKRLCFGAILLAGLVLSFNGCNTETSSGLTTIVISPSGATAVTVTLAPPGMQQGHTQFTAIGYYGHAGHQSTKDITSQVTWSSSLTQVANITTSGMATATGYNKATGEQWTGYTNITASAPGFNGTVVSNSATFTVTACGSCGADDVSAIAIVPAAQTVASLGATVQFVAYGLTIGGETEILNGVSGLSWSSSLPGVAPNPSQAGQTTANTAGVTTITATFTNTDTSSAIGTAVLTVAPSTITPVSSSAPLTSVTIYPPTPTVSVPGQSSQLLAIGTFSTTPTTQDVTAGITALDGVSGNNITTSWSSSDLGVATVATVPGACPAQVTGAISCTLSACPAGTKGETCTTCVTPATASGIYCATSNLVTPIGTVTGVGKGSSVILAISANPDKTLVPASTTFQVLGGSTEAYTALTIYPSGQAATAPAQQSQFMVLGTDGTTGQTIDITDQVQWCSSNPTVATIGSTSTIATTADCANDNKMLSTPPTLPALDPATPGVATALASGNTNITAIYTNKNGGGQVVAAATYSVTIGKAQEPLIAINIIPGGIAVTTKGQSGQFLAFGTYSTTPTVRDLTDKVTWYTSSPELASIESSGASGEAGGIATAMGYTGDASIYAFGSNPDSTVVYSDAVTFTCKDPVTSICDAGPAPVLLATLTVFNSGQIYDTGENQTTWLVTAPDDQGKPNLIHCGPGSAIAGLGNSVCTGTYAVDSNVELTAYLADPATGTQITVDKTFGGWSANCGETTKTTAFTVAGVTFGTGIATITAANSMSAGDSGVFANLTGDAAVLNGQYFTVTSASANDFQVTYKGATAGSLIQTGGTFTITTVVYNQDLLSTCTLPVNTNTSVGAIFYSLSLSCPATTSGTVGTYFTSGPISVSNGTPPYTFSVVGTPPAGLSLSPLTPTTTATVTGTPTAPSGSGTPFVPGPFYITATDANGTQTSTASACAITINK
jgi:hypothetical protein